MKDYQILLYYCYTKVENPVEFRIGHLKLCERLKLKGRIIVAREGINGTVEGLKDNTGEYIRFMSKDLRFKNMHFKKSKSLGGSFPKLSIKVREEIVSASLKDDINPQEVTGKYLTPEQLYNWIHSGKQFYIVDMRNDYEQAIGYFRNSIFAPFSNFRDLPKIIPMLKSLKDRIIVTVCTGGVRCEKASGFLIQNGFADVYQLYGGIVSYMEKYPNEDFLGKLYVFDGRITFGFNTGRKTRIIVGKCKFCDGPAEDYYDCKNIHCRGKRHFISCAKCLEEKSEYCSINCRNLNQKTVD